MNDVHVRINDNNETERFRVVSETLTIKEQEEEYNHLDCR